MHFFEHLDLPEDADARSAAEKIFGKYKDADEALSSIPHREKLVGSRVDFPDPALPTEDLEKAHRGILKKLGALKEPGDYKVDEILKDVDDSVKAAIPEGFVAGCQQQAAELGLLPWQFEKMMAMALADWEGMVRARQDARDAAEREMKRVFGHHLTERMGQAELAADLIDDDIFAAEKAALPEGQRTEKGGPFKQLLRDLNNPYLYRVIAFIHDRLFSEAPPVPRGSTVPQADAYTAAYKRSKSMNPNRPEEYHKKYAEEFVRDHGGAR